MLNKNCPVCNGTGLIPIPVGERVRTLREQAGMTQQELCSQLGLSRPALANIELGRQDVSTDKIIILTRIFDVTADHLLGLDSTE